MSTTKQNAPITGTIVSRGSITGTIAKSVERIEPNIEALTVSANGEYTTPENVHGFNPVTVNVPLKYDEGYADGYKASQDSITLQEKLATENGEYSADEGFTALQKVVVAVPVKEEQEKAVEITKNGTVEVVADEGKALSKVTANVNVAFEGDIGKPYIDTRKITNFRYCFAYGRGNDDDLIANTDFSNGTNFNDAFYDNRFFTIAKVNSEKGTSFGRTFIQCSQVKEISININNGTTFDSMFSGCSKLETLSLTTAKTNFQTSTFQNCSALKNITIGEGWAVNIYLHYSNDLTVESLHGMIENLADLTGQTAKTFQIGATNLAKLDDEHRAMLAAKNWAYS